jgi:hypothetical protein
MKAARRRRREPDSLASPQAVRRVCQLLRERMSDIIPAPDKQLTRFLFAVRHVERRPATDTKRGRPSRWPREKLVEAASHLRDILERETSGRLSVNSFIGQYLPLLQFPLDVLEALGSGKVNLQEAAQLARVTPDRLECSPSEARKQRQEILCKSSDNLLNVFTYFTKPANCHSLATATLFETSLELKMKSLAGILMEELGCILSGDGRC